MSIFYANERRVPVPADSPPTSDQKDAVIAFLSQKRDDHWISCSVGVKLDLVRHYASVCRQIEPSMIAKLASGEITTKMAIVQFVADNTDQFPAAKFVQQCIDNAGGTFAKLVTACQEEVA